MPERTARAERLSRRVVAGYAAGSVGTGGFATLPGLVLAYYLTDTLAVPALLASLAVLVPKVWDVVIDPGIGHLSDAEASRGSRTRLMLLGSVTLPLGFVGMFAAPAGLAPWAAALWVMVAFILATTSFSLFQVPYIALPADLTATLGSNAYGERTRLMAWRIAVLTFTILLVGAGGPALRDAAGNGHVGYLVMGVVTATVVAAGMLAAIAGVRGRRAAGPASDEGGFQVGLAVWREHRPFRVLLSVFVLQALATGIMLAGAQYIATYTLGDQSALTWVFLALVAPALLTMPLWTAVGRRWGRSRACCWPPCSSGPPPSGWWRSPGGRGGGRSASSRWPGSPTRACSSSRWPCSPTSSSKPDASAVVP